MFVSSKATILHADLDAFYASVEQRDNPALRGKPVIVGSGVVLAAATRRRRCGVKTAMGGRRALRLCPDAIVVPPRMEAYTEASRAVFEVFDDTSPQVEALSIDEAFLDARGMERIAGTPEQIARRLRREVRERVGLPITVGVARTKFLAKVASAQAKPDGLLVVPPDGELAFLHPLPIEALWGVGPATAERMRARRDRDGRRRSPSSTRRRWSMLCGKGAGRKLHALAHNRDPRPVTVGAAAALDGHAARARQPPPALVGGARLDRSSRSSTGSRGGCGAAERVCRTATLRMRHLDFSALDPLAHAAGGDRGHDDDPVRVPRAARGARAADRAPRADAARDRADEPRRRARGPARAAARVRARRARSTPRSTTSATATARTRSSARCCSGATPGSRFRCFQIEDRS